MFKAIPLSIFALFLLWATCNAAETGVSAVSLPAITSATTPSPDFESLRIKGLNIALPGPQDTIDPDFAGIRSSLASLGIGYIGWSNNNFYNNLLPHEQSTSGLQTYNGQKPTFFTNNVMQLTYDFSRYGIPDGQIVLAGVYNFDTWEPAGPNAESLATLSYYQTFLNKQVGPVGQSLGVASAPAAPGPLPLFIHPGCGKNWVPPHRVHFPTSPA